MKEHYSTKFGLCEQVWFYRDGLKTGYVTEINLHDYFTKAGTRMTDYYYVIYDTGGTKNYIGEIEEKYLFSSKEEFKEYISKL